MAKFVATVAGLLIAAAIPIGLISIARCALTAEAHSAGVIHDLQPYVDSHTLAGAVTLVASKEKILDLEAIGFADVAAKRPMTTDSLFWIASMSKPMTSTALMMLVDEGKVKIDDPVEKYLPEFQGQMLAVEQDNDHVLLKRPVRPIQVRDILSHTSGLPFMSRIEHKIDGYPLREAVLGYALSPLKFQPGAQYEYSNAGINTAGRIVEKLSGMPYEEFMQRRLLDPLGMKDTTFWPTAEQVARLANSYRPTADGQDLRAIEIEQLTYPLTDRKRAACPAGGLFSTAADVAAFCRMILNGGILDGRRYLSEDSVRQMTSTQTGKLLNHGNGEGGYGFGWQTSRKDRGAADPLALCPAAMGGPTQPTCRSTPNGA